MSAEPPKWMIALGLLVLAVLLIAHAYQFDYTSDDAFISFRYAANLAAGHGLVYNVGERVEGYTNFLWVMLLAPFLRFGADAVVVARLLGLIFAVLSLGPILLLSRKLSRKAAAWDLVPGLFTASCAPFALWALGGLETPLMTFLVLMAVWSDLRTDFASRFVSPLLYALATLTRPDALVFFLVSLVARTLAARRTGTLRRATVTTLGVFLAVMVPYFVWRFRYYGHPWPNTYYAKAGDSPEVYLRGIRYLGGFLAQYWVLGLLLPALFFLGRYRRRDPGVLHLAACSAAYLVFIVKFGGDQLVMYRFLVPILPLLFLLLSEGLAEARRRVLPRGGSSVAAALVVVAATVLLVYRAGLDGAMGRRIDTERTSFAQAAEVGRALREHYPAGTKIAVVLAGIIPYYSGFYTIDMLGLNDEHIAHSPGLPPGTGEPGHEKFDTDYVLGKEPDLIFAAPITLYDSPVDPNRLFSFYQQFSRWAPGNRTLLVHPLLREHYELAGMPVGKSICYFLQRVR